MLISVENITIRVGERRMFEHTSWTIEKDQHWAIVGPTGSGKSSLARAISRRAPLAGGQIRYFFDETSAPMGRPFIYPNEILTYSAETHRQFLRRYAGYHQARWQSFEGEEAPDVASLLNGDEGTGDTQAVIELFDLSHLLRRKVHLLSHGESRKVFIAHLLLRRPRLLILDDPFVGLDSLSRQRLRDAVERLLERQSPAVLLVTSRGEDIPAGIDRILVVRDLRVAAAGNRQQVAEAVERLPSSTGNADLPLPGRLQAAVERYARALRDGEFAAGQELIRLRSVSVTYSEVRILKNVYWTVRHGERCSLLGPNGAGKSTLLSLILADHPQAYTNDVWLFGQKRGSGESIWQIKRRIGWVSPELQIFYDRSLSCLDVAASGFFDSVGLYQRCTPQQAAAALEWLDALGMAGLAHQPFESASTGQQRLVLLARALVKNPPLLILDEPCQGLDDEHRDLFLSIIEQICAQAPVTLIYVSHYQAEIPAAVSHRLVLENGAVQDHRTDGEK